MHSPPPEIVVTGMGLASSIGSSVAAGFDCLMKGGPCFGAVIPYELSGLVRVPKNQKFLSCSARHLMWAGLRALEQSGWTRETLPPERTAIFTGSGQVGLEPSQIFPGFRAAHTSEGHADWAALGGPASRLLDPFFPLRALSNSGLALLAMEVGARGPSNNFVQSDTAGAHALDAAIAGLQESLCDVALAGAFDSLPTPANELNYRRMGLVSPTGCLRPFDRAADGVVLGEAGVALVLERRVDAQARGALIRAGIALDDGLTRPDFIVAAGHGVSALDLQEAAHLDRTVPCTAFKGLTGYLGAATGLVEVALAIEALQARVVPAVVGLSQLATGVELNLIMKAERLPGSRLVSARCLSRSWLGQTAAINVVSY